MAVLQFGISSEIHTQFSSGAKYFPSPTSGKEKIQERVIISIYY